MNIAKRMRIVAVGAVALSLVAGAATVASAAPQTNNSAGPLYLYSGDSGDILADGTPLGWNTSVITAGSGTDNSIGIACPATSTTASQFLSAVGSEGSSTTWSAFSSGGLAPGTLDVIQANVTPVSLYNGNPGQASVKAAGGTYSLGLACMNGTIVLSTFFRTIHVTAVTGAWTFDAQADKPVVPSDTPTPVPSGTSGNVTLTPTTIGVANGVLALTVPTNAAATFGTPSLVNNKSVTTGTLGDITVNDSRVVSREGWTLGATVADFKNTLDATNIISKSQLGVTPKLVVAGTASTGVTVGAPQVAGSAAGSYAFATGAAANTVGNTVLNADLTFVAPQEKAAGTYASTMTLTVVSK